MQDDLGGVGAVGLWGVIQSASRLVTRSAGKPVRATKSSSAGRCGRTWETPTFSWLEVAYMSITGTRVDVPR